MRAYLFLLSGILLASLLPSAKGTLINPQSYDTTGINYSYQTKKYTNQKWKDQQKELMRMDERWAGNDLHNTPLHPLSTALFKTVFDGDISSVHQHFNPDGSWKQSLATPKGKKKAQKPSSQHVRFFNELFALAYSYQFKAADNPQLKGMHRAAYRNPQTKKLIYKALHWYFSKAELPKALYHDTFSYHEAYTLLAPAMCLVGSILIDDIHIDKNNNPLALDAYKNICRYARQIIREQPQRRGANWAFRCDNALLYIFFTRNPIAMDEYRHYVNESLNFNEAQYDGIFPDGTMFHHGDLIYWGMYGTGWTQRWIRDLGPILNKTTWAFSARELNFLQDALLDGVRHVIYRGNTDYATASKRASLLLERTDHVAGDFKDLCQQLLQLGGKQLTRRKELQFLVANTTPDMESYEQYPASKIKEIAGNKHFWVADYTNHRRNHYAIAIKRQSLRTRGVADSDYTGHLHYGANYTSLLCRGDETRLSRFAWDFHNLPGTTLEQGRIISAGRAGATARRGMSLYSGHVSDGLFGAGANEQYIVDFRVDDKDKAGQECKEGRLVERKVNGKKVLMKSLNAAGGVFGNFFIEEGMLALGCNIRNIEIEEDGFPQSTPPSANLPQGSIVAAEQGQILSTLNNTLRRSDIFYSMDGASPQCIKLDEAQDLTLCPKKQLWVWHDKIGYIIKVPEGTQQAYEIKLLAKPLPLNESLKNDKGFKKAIRKSPWMSDAAQGVLNMFALYIRHGSRPQMCKYQYLILMNKSTDEVARAATNDAGIRILRNEQELMAVQQGEELYYALFSQAGRADFGKGKSISVKVPLMIMVRKVKDRYHLTAFNPLHLGSRAKGVPGEGASVGVFYKNGVDVELQGFSATPKTIHFHFPSQPALSDGQSISIEL